MYDTHAADVANLRTRAGASDTNTNLTGDQLALLLAADLLEAHDATGISLDTWIAAREFVERHLGHTITENGA